MKKYLTLWITISFVAIVSVVFSSSAFAAKTYMTTAEINVYDEPNGQVIQTWPSHTLFTSNKEDTEWVRVSGHFPEGEWQSIFPMWYVRNSDNIELQQPQTESAAATIFHQSESLFELPKQTAKAYRLLEPATVFDEQGNALAVWPIGKNFTTAFQTEDSIKVTGHFPESTWEPLETPVWIIKPVRLQDRTQPKEISRADQTRRLVMIDKGAFTVTVYEQDLQTLNLTPIITSPVALGYDRCLPKSQGGKCYYTPEGEFEIEFKLFDTDGIKWCIPKKMEGEFADKIAKGERCWRGIMGNHALHFGDSLFLHGTSNPGSIGSRTTHGCVRLRNSDIEMVYRLLSNGDKVYITSTPDVKLAELSTQASDSVETKNDEATTTDAVALK